MRANAVRIASAVLTGVLLVALPLAGILAARKPLAPYLEFPPVTRYVQHAGFSWTAFCILAALVVLVARPFLARVVVYRPQTPAAARPARRFPWWGWLGLGAGAAAWVLAWTRFAWFAPLQRFTFSPLWFSYIAVVNALTWRQTGRCMLTHRPRLLLALFVASAAFWWYFEYLNRFVQNWYYEGGHGLTPLQYFWMATLPFATVLPAVMGTAEWLAAYPRTVAGLEHAWRRRLARPRAAAVTALALSAAGLAAVGVWPDGLFALLWVAPLAVLLSLQVLGGTPTVLDGLARGDWRRVFRLALAALICGVFWEMWNGGSLARWCYSVPFVNRFHLFEMPLLGYAGYLPFGIECAVVADAVARLLKDESREEDSACTSNS